MPKEESLHFADLPVELVRDIFEIAGDADNSTACSLSLVCRTSHLWMEPNLYHTVLLESGRALCAFSETLASKPADFAARRIRRLGIFASGPLTAIYRVLSACSGVSSLACGFSLPSFARQYPDASHKLALAAREQHLLMFSCRDTGRWADVLVSRAVTHLRIHIDENCWDVLSPPRLREQWPALTHLGVVFTPRAGTSDLSEAYAVFSRVLSELNLTVLLIQVTGASARRAQTAETLNRLAQERGDCQLVAEAAPLSTVRQWERCMRTGRCGALWDSAEGNVFPRRSRPLKDSHR